MRAKRREQLSGPGLLRSAAGWACTLVGILALSAGAARATDFHVAVSGDDANPGTRERPFASLERARDAVRRLPRPLSEPVTVWLRGGTYLRTRELEFYEQDSGSATAPITYRSAEGETVRLIGGPILRDWQPVRDPQVLGRLDGAAKRNVRQLDLRAAGVSNFGQLRSRGWGRPPEIAYTEIFLDGERMTLARWPNKEWTKIAGFPKGSSRNDNHGGEIGEIDAGFLYGGERPRDWHQPTNVWIHGFWAWNWANSHERIERIDYDRHWIKTASPGGHFGFRPGQRIWFYYAIEELDAPGEWYLDRDTGILYFWPPRPLEGAEVIASTLERPFMTFRNTSFVRLQGLSFEGTRSFGIWIQAGRSNQVSSCVVRDIGNYGIWVEGGTGHSVVGCDVYETGDGGVGVKGGDRNTLTPGGHRVENCHLHHNGDWTYTYVPAVRIGGVGQVVAHNLIHDHPHTAILFEGNDHIIEYNEIHHVALDTGDTGAIYTGRDWSFRGNKIRFNYLHDIVGFEDFGKGVYMDDCSSGAEITGNVFQHMKRAIHLAGGRDHKVENNQFIDCDTGIDVDGRGLDRSPIWQAGQKIMRDQWNALPKATRELYLVRYPELQALMPYIAAEKPVPPEGTVIARNVSSGGGKFLDVRWHAEKAAPEQRNNTVAREIKLRGKSKSDLRAKPDSAALKAGFKPIPFDDIGLQENGARSAIPRVPTAPAQ